MDKKKQNLAWASLSKEMRLDIVQLYVEFQDESRGDYINRPFWVSIIRKFETIFGHHNLTSDTEPEEILMVERKKVQDAYKAITSDMRRAVLEELFGDKCLPDTPNTPNSGGLKLQEVDNETDKELEHGLEQPSVQVEPKFDIGDDVIFEGKPYKITGCQHFKGRIAYSINIPNGEYKCLFKESDLEPYTEPISQNLDENCDNADLNSKSDNMEEKGLNCKAIYNALCELEAASIKVRKALIASE